ncbi:MAG TPA: 16S rRNA (guanine(966)-N(2))-methyltransferase RsmD [Pseudonocardia sp.]|jgi:16S rRNA (guanine966-N2)-methyltransferase
MTRIIAGTVGGRRIAVPAEGTRPTSERVREALFSSLQADPGLDGLAVLDLYAGSGALGLEALSRGAARALFVESDRRAAGVLRRNIGTLGLGGVAEVRTGAVAAVLAGPAPARFDLVLADPPYSVDNDELVGWLRAAAAHGWLAEDATVVLERPARSAPVDWPAPLRAERDRRYGDTVLRIGLCYGSASW